MRTHFVLALVLAFAAASGYAQQKMYKSVMPDGKVIYSAKPEPNAKRVETVEPPPPSSGITTVTPQEKARAEQMKREQQARSAGQGSALEEARKQLKQAEAARDAAKEPAAGDRLGTAKGGSRLTEDYFARQKAADDVVAAARKRVEDLERGR